MSLIRDPKPAKKRFPLGAISATPPVLQHLLSLGLSPGPYLDRHQTGDWGTVPAEDAEENELSIAQGLRIQSAYPLTDGRTIWVITEADRSLTTVLFPEEY